MKANHFFYAVALSVATISFMTTPSLKISAKGVSANLFMDNAYAKIEQPDIKWTWQEAYYNAARGSAAGAVVGGFGGLAGLPGGVVAGAGSGAVAGAAAGLADYATEAFWGDSLSSAKMHDGGFEEKLNYGFFTDP